MKKFFTLVVLVLVAMFSLLTLSGCTKNETVTHNIQQNADNFKVYRKMTFINLRTDKVLYTAEGYFSLNNTASDEIGLTFKVDSNTYKINYFGIGEGVTYIIEQTENTNTNPYHYEIHIYGFIPELVIDPE